MVAASDLVSVTNHLQTDGAFEILEVHARIILELAAVASRVHRNDLSHYRDLFYFHEVRLHHAIFAGGRWRTTAGSVLNKQPLLRNTVNSQGRSLSYIGNTRDTLYSAHSLAVRAHFVGVHIFQKPHPLDLACARATSLQE